MRPVECVREHEVLDALASHGPVACWNQGPPKGGHYSKETTGGHDAEDLKSHVESCAICRDLVTVASALLDEHHVAVEHANPPSSGIVWWRAQMRARQEAAQAATRPITVVQGLALASGAAIVLLVLSATAPTLLSWFSGLVSGIPGFEFLSGIPSVRLPSIELSALMPSTTLGLLLLVGGLTIVLLGPLAAYFALGDE